MNDIWWQTIGEGDCHLVLLHGWGLNAQVWDCITPQLASHFTLHPGGSAGLWPQRRVWGDVAGGDGAAGAGAGPSTGGVAGLEPGRAGGQPVAIMRPERVQALVMVASSPLFRGS